MDELWADVIEKNFDVIGIAETWLDEEISQAAIAIDGYTIYRKDRHKVKSFQRGGVILYVNNRVSSCAVKDLNEMKAEAVWCKLVLDNRQEIVVGVCY